MPGERMPGMDLVPFFYGLFGTGPTVFVVGIGLGVGFTLALATQPRNIRLAHYLFGFAWIWAYGRTLEVFLEMRLPVKISIPLVFICAGVIGVLGFLSVTWVETNHRDAKGTNQDLLIKPTITWATPAPITEGTPRTTKQLDAAGSVDGSPAYVPGNGAILPVGTQRLLVVFAPSDQKKFSQATKEVQIVVNPKLKSGVDGVRRPDQVAPERARMLHQIDDLIVQRTRMACGILSIFRNR
jgi:hypothetical protein